MAEKIGVYFDGASIGRYFDLEDLVSHVETKHAAAVTSVKAHPFLASDAGVAEIKKDLDEGTVGAVLICGSSPRADWDAYRFDRPDVIVERVNLREQCAMCFQNPDGSRNEDFGEDAPELLVQMAKEYVDMGVVKLQKANVPKPEVAESTSRILVLGGGWAGMTAAMQAAAAGYEVVLVEKEGQLGGMAAKWSKITPLAYPHVEAQDSGVDKLIEKVLNNPKITVHTSTKIKELRGAPGKYTAVLAGSGDSEVPVGAVVLATGWVPQNTKYLKGLGYGSLPNMVTTMEYEEMVKEGALSAKKVAFILNTAKAEPKDIYGFADTAEAEAEEEAPAAPAPEGDEEDEVVTFQDTESARHLPYAKAVNTMVALKQARHLADQGGVAYLFYDHMIVPGIHERYYKAAQDQVGVMMTKADIAEIVEDGGGLKITATNTLFGHDIEVGVDMVVVPTGMVPTTAKDPVVNFVYRQGPAFPDLDLFDGFADSNYICFPYETRRTGVYAAGAVRQPMLMDAAMEDATGAALKAIQCIESVNRGVSVHPRSGDLSYPVFNFTRCTQCKRCTEECPFGALDDDEKGTPMPNPSRCRRCGTCMGACPERVISFDNYNIDQVGTMIRQVYVPDDMEEGGPRFFILACENDAYPALDMAALRGKSWSPYVRIIPVRCLGSINAIWVADAMSKGIDGVMLLGCKYGDDYQCHFVKGSEICNRRKENIAETLNRLGVQPERVNQYEVAIDDYDKVPGMIDQFIKEIVAMGPNPFKGY